MRYTLYINQHTAIKLGITNINLAHVFDLLTSVATWAETEIIDDDVYYWVARQKISKELSILSLKSDTIYRHLKKLNELGLIDYIKLGKKDCIRITKLGKKYLSKDYVGNESEKDSNSDLNPTKLGNESEKDSDLNPTYNTTKSNPTTNDNKNNTKRNSTSFKVLLEKIREQIKAKSKVKYSTVAEKNYLDCKYSDEEIISIYTRYIKTLSSENYMKKIEDFFLDIEQVIEDLNKSKEQSSSSLDAVDEYFKRKEEEFETLDAEVVDG